MASSRFRTGIVIASVLLGIAALAASQLTNDALSRGLERAWRTSMGISHLQVRAFSTVGFSDATIDRVRALPDVAAVSPVAKKKVFFRTTREGDRGFVELIGVDPAVEPTVREYRVVAGRFVTDDLPNGVVTRASWAEEHGLRVGDRFELITRDGLRDFELIGLLALEEAGVATYGPVVLITLNTARDTFGMRDRIGAMSLVLSSEAAIPQVRTALSQAVREPHVIRRSPEIRAELARAISELQAMLTLFGAATLFVAVFLIWNTVEMAVVDQTGQIGQLRAAGADRGQIFAYFLVQGLLPGVVGSTVGALAGYGLAQGLAAWVERSQQVAVAPVIFSLPTMLLSIAAGFLVVVLSTLAPALRASRMNPVEMIVSGQAAAGGRVGWLAVLVGLGLIVLSGAAMFLPVDEQVGRLLRAVMLFPLLVGVVLVSRMAVVPLSQALGALSGRVGGASGRFAARNLVREIGRTTLTVAGFMVSLSLLVGLASVALSSVRAGERWTLSLIPSEFVVVSPVDQPPVFIAQFAALSGAQYASPVSFLPALAGRSLVQLAAIEPSVFGPGLEIVEASRQEAIAAMEAGGAVLVPRSFADANRLRAGDQLQIQTAAGPQPFTVAAIIAHSFPSPAGTRTVLMSRADAEQFFGPQGFRLIMVGAASGADPTALRARVAELAERYGMSASSAEGIAAEVADAIWRLLALIGALVAIGILVGAFGTANTMLMNVAQRAREIGILRAVGMSRAELRFMVVAEAAMMGLMGGILGTLVGALLSWILVSLAGTRGFTPDYVFPWSFAAIGIALAVLAAGLAALIPARRVADVNYV